MTTPSQIAVESERLISHANGQKYVIAVIEDAIDKATAGMGKEIESLKEQRNRAAMEERQKYLPMMEKMVSIEDVKPLLNALGSGTSSYQYTVKDNFLAKHGDKLKATSPLPKATSPQS
jgi:hypothetical protein